MTSLQKNYEKDFDDKVKRRFANTYIFCKGDISKCGLLLQKVVCPLQYIDGWEKFNKALLPKKTFFRASY